MAVVVGPCDRVAQKPSSLRGPSDRRMTRDTVDGRNKGRGGWGDGSGSSERRVDAEVEREKRQALDYPF